MQNLTYLSGVRSPGLQCVKRWKGGHNEVDCLARTLSYIHMGGN